MFLNINDVLDRYDIKRTTLWRWRNTLGFPASITSEGSRPLWRLEDIKSWEDRNKL